MTITSSTSFHPLLSLLVVALLFHLNDVTASSHYLRHGGDASVRRDLLPDWLCSYFDDSVERHPECLDNYNDTNITCPLVEPLPNTTDAFNLTEFTSHSWFVQKQQINGFQPNSTNDFFCLVHTFTQRDEDEYLDYIPFGTVGSIDGPMQEWDVGLDNLPDHLTSWCAGQDEEGGGLLRISPCLLRSLLRKVGIPFWIFAVADDYSWTIVSGGEPLEPRQVHPPLCTTRTNVSADVLADTSGTGLWLMTRAQLADNETIAEMETLLDDMGIYTGELYPVVQEGCTYNNNTIIM